MKHFITTRKITKATKTLRTQVPTLFANKVTVYYSDGWYRVKMQWHKNSVVCSHSTLDGLVSTLKTVVKQNSVFER